VPAVRVYSFSLEILGGSSRVICSRIA